MSYYQKKLYPFIEELIRSHNLDVTNSDGYHLSVDDLELCEQYQFAGHLIEHYKRDLDSFYDNSSQDEIVKALVNVLANDSTEMKLNFAEIVMWEVVDYYKPTMQTMIDEAIGWVEQEDREDAGYVSRQDRNNGETYWVKA